MQAQVRRGATLADYIGAHLARLPTGVSQKDIAMSIGYTNANILVMFKKGLTKVPIGKINPLAKALKIDPAHLLRMALGEYDPQTLEAIEEAAGRLVSENEYALIQAYRNATGNINPDLTSEFMESFSKLAGDLAKSEINSVETDSKRDLRVADGKKGNVIAEACEETPPELH